MKQLHTGQFHGQTNQTTHLDGITLTDTIYTHSSVDWHYHENAYFTFILQGKVIEGNKKEVYTCSEGSLLFHNWEDPHYNIKPEGFTRGFHIELGQKWMTKYALDLSSTTGSLSISNPDLKIILFNIFKESKTLDQVTTLSIESLIIELLSRMISTVQMDSIKKPAWVRQVKTILHDQYYDPPTLSCLSNELNIHPAHLSRDFSKYFHCNIGEYIRRLKLEKAFSLLINNRLSLVDIAYESGFADQSHFIRCFKSKTGLNPLSYRKIMLQ